MTRFSAYRDFDWTLFGFVMLMSLISVLEIYSATLHTKFHGFHTRQMMFLGIAVPLMFIISLIDYHRLLEIAHWAYGISIASLLAVLVVGKKEAEAKSIALRRLGGETQDIMPLSEAVVDAGAVRFRPMLLTAMAVVVGASVILADPIFQGLAISLIAGEIASLLISRMAVPVIYYMAFSRKSEAKTTTIPGRTEPAGVLTT